MDLVNAVCTLDKWPGKKVRPNFTTSYNFVLKRRSWGVEGVAYSRRYLLVERASIDRLTVEDGTLYLTGSSSLMTKTPRRSIQLYLLFFPQSTIEPKFRDIQDDFWDLEIWKD